MMVATAPKIEQVEGKIVPTTWQAGNVVPDDEYDSTVRIGDEIIKVKKNARFNALQPLTEAEVLDCQKNWAGAIAAASKIYADGGDYIGAAADAANQLYGYGHSQVLFKPTKAAAVPFRPTAADAMSYFVGGDVVEGGYEEDAGFAINGGKGWEKVEFFNHAIDLNGLTATAMGYYLFTDATTKDEVRVEYTFGYKRCSDGKVRIFLHHSSVPFKPTKAAEYPFRPTGGEAMSYFVGGSVVEGGYDEDAGFAINGGKGWKDVVFTNHNIE